jgi:hypothetical protein
VHDPGDFHLPVDLLGVLGAVGLERLPAAGAGPFGLGHVVDFFAGLEVGVVPPPVPLAPPSLAAPRLGRRVARARLSTRARLATRVRVGTVLLLFRLPPEQHPGEHSHLLRQLRNPLVRLRQPRLGSLGTPTPVRRIGGDVFDHRRGGHAIQDTPPESP